MKKMVYLDVCVLSRPYDDQSQLRVRLEANAVLLIMDAIQNSMFILRISPVHFVETGAIKDDRERVDIEVFLVQYGRRITGDVKLIRGRAEFFWRHGLGAADAAHLAFAEAGADFMISCDDRFVKQARKMKLGCGLLTPLEFCEKERIK